MGIELATYCPELKHNENNEDNRANTVNPVDTLSSLQGDISALMLSLDAIMAAHPRQERQINSLPERLSDLMDYLERLRPSECRFVLGNWEEEVVYVNLYHAVERGWLAPFHGNVNINIGIRLETGEWDSVFTYGGYCVGCIEGTDTALIFMDCQDEPKCWLLWTPARAVQEGWAGVDSETGLRGRFVEVGEDLNIRLGNPLNGWVEEGDN